MPTYVYEIVSEDGSGGQTFELFQSMSEPALTVHPETGEPVRRVPTAPMIGGNWTDASSKSKLSESKLERLGFTKYQNIGSGQFEKRTGRGPEHISGLKKKKKASRHREASRQVRPPSPMSNPIITMADWARRREGIRRLGRWSLRLIPDIGWTVRVPQLGPVRIRLRRHRWFLYEEFGRGDDLAFGGLRRIIRPGDVVYDIGANIGVYARVMVQWMDAGSVVAFEPMTQNLELLRSNVRLGGLDDRVRVLDVALSDRDGEEELQVDDVTSGTAVLSSVSGGEASAGRLHQGLAPKTERVRVAALDGVISSHDLPSPDAMKIDTEGAEAIVLRGARRTLADHGPRLAIATHGEVPARESLELIIEIGYRCFGFVHDGDGERWRELTTDDAARLANNNILASMDGDELVERIEPYGIGH